MPFLSTRRRLPPAAVLFLCLFAAQSALLVLSPILPLLAADLGVTSTTAAQLRSCSGITAGTAALYLAVRGANFRLAGLLELGLLFLAAGSAASALAPTFFLLLAAQVVIGVGLAMVLSGGLAASEAWAGSGDGHKTLSWALIGQPIAWIVGQPVAGTVAEVHWRWAWVAVPLAASVIALGAVALRATSRSEEDVFDCDPAGLWRLGGMRAWAVGELAAFSAWAGILVFSGAFFIETYGVGVGVTGLVLGLVAAAYLPGNFLSRRMLVRDTATPLLGSAVSLAVVAIVFGTVRPGVVFSTVMLGLLAFFAGARTIAGATAGLQISAGRRLAAMSVRTSVLQFGYLIGTATGGLVIPVWGYAGMGWTFAGFFLVAGSVHLRAIGRGGLWTDGDGYLRRSRPALPSD